MGAPINSTKSNSKTDQREGLAKMTVGFIQNTSSTELEKIFSEMTDDELDSLPEDVKKEIRYDIDKGVAYDITLCNLFKTIDFDLIDFAIYDRDQVLKIERETIEAFNDMPGYSRPLA